MWFHVTLSSLCSSTWQIILVRKKKGSLQKYGAHDVCGSKKLAAMIVWLYYFKGALKNSNNTKLRVWVLECGGVKLRVIPTHKKDRHRRRCCFPVSNKKNSKYGSLRNDLHCCHKKKDFYIRIWTCIWNQGHGNEQEAPPHAHRRWSARIYAWLSFIDPLKNPKWLGKKWWIFSFKKQTRKVFVLIPTDWSNQFSHHFVGFSRVQGVLPQKLVGLFISQEMPRPFIIFQPKW